MGLRLLSRRLGVCRLGKCGARRLDECLLRLGRIRGGLIVTGSRIVEGTLRGPCNRLLGHILTHGRWRRDRLLLLRRRILLMSVQRTSRLLVRLLRRCLLLNLLRLLHVELRCLQNWVTPRILRLLARLLIHGHRVGRRLETYWHARFVRRLLHLARMRIGRLIVQYRHYV